METLKNTLACYDNAFRIVIIDFLRDSKILSVDQAAKLNTFHQEIESGSNADTGRESEKIHRKKAATHPTKKTKMAEAIRQASERFPTPELPKTNPIKNPFEGEWE